MSEVKVILSLQTEQVAKKAAEAGESMEAMAEESAQAVREAASSSEEAVSKAAASSSKSVESVKEAADEAAESLRETGSQASGASSSTEKGMQSAASSIKGAAGATQGMISSLGGISPKIALIGQALQVLLSGPVAMITAAVTALIAFATAAWDALTVSAEEYRQTLEAVADLQQKVVQQVQDEADISRNLLDRLEEINRLEEKGNVALRERDRLMAILKNRYGELEFQFDDDGNILNLNLVREYVQHEDTARLLASLRDERETQVAMLPPNPRREYRIQDAEGSEIYYPFKDGDYAAERRYYYEKLQSGSLTDKDEITQVKERIDALDRILSLDDRIARLAATGYASDAAEASALREATLRDGAWRAGMAAQNAPSSPPPPPPQEDSKAVAISSAVQGVIDRYRMLRREQELIADGREREAVIERETVALRQRAAQMGVELTEEQIGAMEDAVGSWYDYTQSLKPPEPDRIDRTAEMEDIAGQIAALYRPDAPGMVTNSLVARGGSATGIRMPDLERYQRATSESTARLVELTEEQSRIIAEGALI